MHYLELFCGYLIRRANLKALNVRNGALNSVSVQKSFVVLEFSYFGQHCLQSSH